MLSADSCIFLGQLLAQQGVAVNIDGGIPHASTMLDVKAIYLCTNRKPGSETGRDKLVWHGGQVAHEEESELCTAMAATTITGGRGLRVADRIRWMAASLKFYKAIGFDQHFSTEWKVFPPEPGKAKERLGRLLFYKNMVYIQSILSGHVYG